MAAGFFMFTFISASTSIWFIMFGMLLVGLGLGQLMQTLTIASQNAVGPRDIGVATSSATFFRQIGGTLGVAIVFSVLFNRLPATIAAAFAEPTLKANLGAALADPKVLTNPANTTILNILKKPSLLGDALNGNTAFLSTSDHRLVAPFLHGFADATVTGFWVSLIVILIAFVLSFFLKATPLRQKSAIQEVADADAAILATQAAEMVGAPLEPAISARDLDGAQEESARRS
jgi:hypothetical protein